MRAHCHFVALSALLSAAACTALLSCGGAARLLAGEEKAAPQALSAGPLTRTEALEQLEALPTPAGVSPQLFGELKQGLRTMLKQGPAKYASSPPTGLLNQIQDLTTGIDDLGNEGIQWNYKNAGDYDLNSEVNISDLTPIGQHFGKTEASADWLSAARFADGDGNGEVNIADITPIGMNFLRKVAGYRVEGGPAPEGPFTELGEVAFESGRPLLTGIRMYHYLPAVQHPAYRVIPLDVLGIPGEPSLPSVEFLVSERTRIVGNPDDPMSPQFNSRAGNQLLLDLPPGAPSPLAVGDVVVGSDDGGYLLRVLEVNQAGQHLEVIGEPATLSDVFLQGGLTQALDDISQVPPALYTIDLGGQVLCDVPGLNAVVEAGSIAFLPKADVAVNYNQYGGVTYLKGLAEGGPLDFNMNVVLTSDELSGPFPASEADKVNFEHLVTSFNFDFLAYQNNVPVTMTLNYEMYTGIEGEGEFFGAYAAEATSQYDGIKLGGIYTLDGGIQEFNEFSQAQIAPPTQPTVSSFGGDVRFSAYCRAEIHIKLYGNPVAGNSEDLALTLSPRVQLSGAHTSTPEVGMNFSVDAALDNSYLMALYHIGMGTDLQQNFFPTNPLFNVMTGFIPTITPPG